MKKYSDKLLNSLNLPEIIEDILSISIRILFLYLVIKVVAYFLLLSAKRYFIYKGKKDHIVYDRRQKTIEEMLKSLFRYISFPILIIGILDILGVNTATLLTGAGVVGVALGFAFQDLLKDVVAGFFIVLENVFSVGDYVRIKNYTGYVVKIGIKSSTLQAYTQEIFIISNREIVEAVNYSSTPYIITINKFPVSLDTNFDELFKELNTLLAKIKEKYHDKVIDLPYIKGVDTISDYAAIIEINTKVKSMEQFFIRREVQKEVLTFLKEKGIKIPYPTYSVLGGK